MTPNRSFYVFTIFISIFALLIVNIHSATFYKQQYNCKARTELKPGEYIKSSIRPNSVKYYKLKVPEKKFYRVYFLYASFDLVLLDGNCRIIKQGAMSVSGELNPGIAYVAVKSTYALETTAHHITIYDPQVKSLANLIARPSRWNYARQIKVSYPFKRGRYHAIIRAANYGNGGKITIQVRGPEKNIQKSSGARQESAHQLIKRKYRIDLDKWFNVRSGEFPEQIATLKLGQSIADHNMSTWNQKRLEDGKIHWELADSSGDLGQIISDPQGKITAIAHTFNNKSEDFIRTIIRYAKERFGNYFKKQFEEKGTQYHSFNLIKKDQGISNTFLICIKENMIWVQVFQEPLSKEEARRVQSRIPQSDVEKIRESTQNALAEYFPNVKIKILNKEGSMHLYFDIWKDLPNEEYFNRLINVIVKLAATMKSLYSDQWDWSAAKVYMTYHKELQLGWILFLDCETANKIQDPQKKAKFLQKKFHWTDKEQ